MARIVTGVNFRGCEQSLQACESISVATAHAEKARSQIKRALASLARTSCYHRRHDAHALRKSSTDQPRKGLYTVNFRE
jgi:hypothetical protein